MRYFRATVEYDGTDFFGFQVQPNVPTIQGALEEAIARVTTERSRVVAAGRTDTGVHARGQVIAFHSPWPRQSDELLRAINAVLPESIALLDLEEEDESFHPRYSARSREYRYFIHQRPIRSPLRLRYSLHVPYPLDAAAMQEVAHHIVGTHDFATFGEPTSGESTVREVFISRWERHDDEWVYIIEGNGFLRRMVRTLVMAQLWVGEGRWTPEDFDAALAAHDRSLSPPPVEPRGLHLWRVVY